MFRDGLPLALISFVEITLRTSSLLNASARSIDWPANTIIAGKITVGTARTKPTEWANNDIVRSTISFGCHAGAITQVV